MSRKSNLKRAAKSRANHRSNGPSRITRPQVFSARHLKDIPPSENARMVDALNKKTLHMKPVDNPTPSKAPTVSASPSTKKGDK